MQRSRRPARLEAPAILLRRLCCVALSCSCGLLLLGGATAWAAPAWLAPADVSTSGLADDPIVAADSQGDMTAVWLGSDGVHASVLAAVRPAGGAWPPPVELSSIDRNADDPAVAVDPQGDATAVWVREDATGGTLQAAMRPAGGTWQSPVDVSSAPDLEDPEVAVDSQGDAIAVWDIDNGTNTVQAAVRPAGGAWQAPVDLSSHAADAADPQVAFDADGNATAVWQVREGTSEFVQAATRPTGGAWQAPVDLTARGQYAGPQLAIDPAGDAIAAWNRYDGANFIVQAAVRPADSGAWQSPVDLSAAANSSYLSQVAIDPQGDAIAVWLNQGTHAIVQAAVRPEGQAWGIPTDLSADDESADDPHVAFDAHGNAIAVWTRSNGVSVVAQAASRPAGGAWQTPVDLSATGADALHPQVAVDPQGNAIAVWSRNFTIQAAGYDAAGPLLRGLSIPASGTAGIPVSLSVSPLDVWSALGATDWSFGDGQTGTGETLTHTYAKPGSYTVGVSSSDALANATSTTAQITIAPAPAIAPPVATGPTPPTPTLTGVSQAHRKWREAEGNAVLAATSKHKLPVGTSFAFTLNETAPVTFAFTQTTVGRRVAGKCEAADQHNRTHVRCRRTLTRGTLIDTAGAGPRTLAFQGQINGRRLPQGAYTVTLTATSDSGQRSRPHALRFAIVG
jgi:PKD domain